MMSLIRREDSEMPSIVVTTWRTTAPPCLATSAASAARPSAWRALSAFLRTVWPSCSMVAVVSCSALACCSVRPDRSWLPWASSSLALATLSALRRTPVTTRCKADCISDKACSSGANSSCTVGATGMVRSPSRTRSATFLATLMRWRSMRENHSANPPSAPSTTSMVPASTQRAALVAALKRPMSAASASFW